MGFIFDSNDLLEYASPKDVHKYCNSYDLFRYYVGDFKLGKPILSPLQKEERPSFSLFARGSQVFYKDFRLGGGDIIKFVRERYGLGFQAAINKIIYDSGLSDKFRTDLDYEIKPIIRHAIKLKNTYTEIAVKSRIAKPHDIAFWREFNISPITLNKYRVRPISHVFYNGKIVIADKYAYAFLEMKDDKPSYTIYQPYNDDMKFRKNHDSSVFYGWSQLPETGSRVIITKSMKDVMCINETTGIPVVSLQGEAVAPKKHVIDELKNRFEQVFLFYDNDWDKEVNWGRKFSKGLAKKLDLVRVEIPDIIAERYNAKDYSDLVKNWEEDLSPVIDMLGKDINQYIV